LALATIFSSLWGSPIGLCSISGAEIILAVLSDHCYCW
jgi:hypothetical protein